MEYKIYKITNLINNKVYIGKTRRTLEIRMKEHIKGNGECRAIIGAIKKYGKENFKIEQIDIASSWEDSMLKESKWIVNSNSLVPNGYNLSLECPSGGTAHKESIEKMCKILQGNQYTKRTNNYIGVRKRNNCKSNIFEARVKKNKICYSKLFSSEIEAAEAYDRLVLFLYGKTSKLNFIDNLNDYLNEDLELFFNNFIKKKNKSSKYIGVSFHKSSNKWQSVLCFNKKHYYLGIFNNDVDAFEARNKKIKELTETNSNDK